ncbi:MAG: phosphate ABC transporter ATP-binding protein [Nitrospirales bacterium]|nr:MAG: phosphate ABC transporter ATP-binding protein [Nitrospirales bacterium]
MNSPSQVPKSQTASSSIRNIAPCCDPDPLIQTTDLSLTYSNRPAFERISLTVHRGCLTAIVGPSGSGKTSFLLCLNRLIDLLPECKVSGQAHIENLDILSPTIDVLQLRRRIGMIFQKPNPFPMSIQKNLEFPLKEHGVTEKDLILERTQQALMDVGLWNEVKDRMDTSALLLSGGQQQRLCMARALVLSPEVLLMDEPCSALDPLSSGTVEDLIFSLRGQYTVIIVTHNLAQAHRIADYVGVFWNQKQAGELIEFGPTQEIFEHPQQVLTAAYINGVRG